jgi:predicted O-methyltransferase YrrM
VKRLLRALVDRLPHVAALHEQVAREGKFPAGHYHSPVPSLEDLRRDHESRPSQPADLPDVRLEVESQRALLEEYARFYTELSFPERPDPTWRFHYDQVWFTWADAIFLHCFLRRNLPRRIVEVGSGYSSAVMLDTLDRHATQPTELTFIEPHPERLLGILREGDRERVRIVEASVQDAPIETLTDLGPGDLLFIDSSHVLKAGSDVKLLLFEVLPRLPPGVFVHFHDIFFPFEYPPEWLADGWYWNEAYVLRAFLAHNEAWSIHFFNTLVALAFPDFLRERMPLCLKNPGGSLYLRRTA